MHVYKYYVYNYVCYILRARCIKHFEISWNTIVVISLVKFETNLKIIQDIPHFNL